MYLTIETQDTFYSIPVHKSYTKQSEVDIFYTIANTLEKLGLEVLDYKKTKIAQAPILNINWQPIVNAYRSENVVLRRKPRKFFVR